jgi:16S rRNA processing protein RimM
MSGTPQKQVILGRISGLMGIKGWVKVHSYTEPRESIVGFGSWILCGQGAESRVKVEGGRLQGRTVVAKLQGVDDCDEARALIGTKIAVAREDLPACGPGEYYWADLEGLDVRTLSDEALGCVDFLFGTGDHDVMVVAGTRERMIPFVQGRIVHKVDLDCGVIIVDWDPSY